MAQKLTKETMDKLVDVVLEHDRTPRGKLFEYPYTTQESNQIIQRAQMTAERMTSILGFSR